MRAALTDLTVRSLKEGTYFDTKTPAFGVRVGKLRKTWIIVRGAERQQTIIGHYPELSLAEARLAARKAQTEPVAPRVLIIPFAQVRSAYLDAHPGRESTKAELKRLLTKHFAALDAKNVTTITDGDIQRQIGCLARSEALHAFRAVRALFRWAQRPPRRFVAHSPLEGFEAPSKDGRGTRTLTDAEVTRILGAAHGQPGALTKLMLLWGTRIGETLALRRDWVADGVLTIPANTTKNGRPHTIPLLPMAHAILDAQKERGPYFFPGRWNANTHINAGSWGKCHRELMTSSNTKGWSAHSLRRTFRYSCARFGVGKDLAERLLNHAQGALDEIYDHYNYLPQKIDALGRVEKLLQSLSEPPFTPPIPSD
jgi:integrase